MVCFRYPVAEACYGQIPKEQLDIHLLCVDQVYLIEIFSNEHKVHTAETKLSDDQEDVHSHPV